MRFVRENYRFKFNSVLFGESVKIIIILLIAIVFADPANAARSSRHIPENEKFRGNFIVNCKTYQFGSDEIVLSTHVRRPKNNTSNVIIAPEVQTDARKLRLIFANTQVQKASGFDSLQDATKASTPSIIDFKAHNWNFLNSDDEYEYNAIVELELDSDFELSQNRRTQYGFQFILKLLHSEQEQSQENLVSDHDTPKNSFPFKLDQRVTLELRDTELKDLLRVLCSHIDRNVIIDPSMPNPTITMSLNNVRIDEVFNFLMRTYGIYCYSAGVNTISFGSRDGLYKLSGEEDLKTFPIAYADLDAIRPILASLTKLPEANFIIDKRLRNIYVRANPSLMNEISKYLNMIDAPGKQIMIHASIFEFSDSAQRDVENAINAVYDHYNFNFDGDSGASLIGMRRWPNPFNITTDNDDEVEINSGRAELVVYNSFKALETKGKGKVLANPSVIAIDGQEAKISMTEDYPYVSARDDDGNVTWSTQNVGPQLTFTPKIGRDGEVSLKINIETGEVIEMMRGSNGEQMPRTSKRSVNTEIRVRDGMPFVIGGLFRENNTRTRNKIPILGDIPLLGNFLFSTHNKSNVKTQVVIIVTPYILDSGV